MDKCLITTCEQPGEISAVGSVADLLGKGTVAILKPIPLCKEHARVLKDHMVSLIPDPDGED